MAPSHSAPRVLFYVQHLLGIGHLMRAGTLTRALEAEGFRVTLVSGGTPVPVFDSHATRFVQLPPAHAVDKYFKVIVDENGERIDDDWKARRRERLLDVYDAVAPDAVLIELYPFGRRQMRFEIEPLLDHAKAGRDDGTRPLIASSVRDILVQPDKPERIDEIAERIERYFDLVLVHGDPDLVSFEESFSRLHEIGHLTRYTGYVVDPPPAPGGPGAPGYGEVVVSTGGGAVSEDMLQAALGARAMSSLAEVPWRVLIGYNFPEARFRAYRKSAPRGVIIERARSDFLRLLANCRLSISQGGYNTVMEILATGAPAVCMPYAGGFESEQTARCRLLAARGVIEVVEQHDVSAANVALAVERAIRRRPGVASRVNLDGARRSAALLHESIRRHALDRHG